MTQTVPTEYSNKLVQCLIKIPSLDAPPKSNCHSEVQAVVEKAEEEVFFQKALPDNVRPEIFKVVSTFDVDNPGSRNITTGSYDYGISFGHITAADMEKSLFRENLLAKSAYYTVSFNRQDFGVVDLFFGEEEHFVTVLTHIRKMRIGQRHLVVTYCKTLKETERAPECPVFSVKATIIYNQNFATTDFIANSKAPLWNRPKVEELLTVHNMPEGIPLDFLKLIIPDALSVEMDDKKQKFTQKGSRVHLGLDRKKGADSFMKLFTHMYINNECLVFSAFGSPVSSVPELAGILEEKKSRENEMKNVRELKAVSRDINATPYVGKKEEVEVIMKVETEASTKKILSPAPGSSTVQHPQQPVGTLVSSKAPAAGSSTNPAFSDVSDELSDISDTSDIGVETAVSKTSQKTATAVPKTSQKTTTSPTQKKTTPLVYKTSRIQHHLPSTRPAEKKGSKNESLTSGSRTTVRKTSGLTSKASELRKETRDRLLDKNRKSSLSKPLDKSIHGIHSSRPRSHDVRKERHDRVGHVSSSDRGKERPAHRLSKSGSKVREEPEASRDRSRRDQPHVESARRGSYDKASGHPAHGRNAGGQGRHAGDRGRAGRSSSRAERTRNRSEDRDNVKLRVTPTVDRHGIKIVSYRSRRDFIRKTHGSQDNDSDTFSLSKMDRYEDYPERDVRRGNTLDLLLQKRLGSLERKEREADDSRHVILTRSRSPITRQIYRGRSASPRKHQSMSVRVRQSSPSAVYGSQQRLLALRRSRSPRQTSHSSVLSPISAGENEADVAQEGMWLPQPPVTLDSHQDLRTSSRSASYTRLQAQWKSQISSDESEKEAFSESQSARFIEQFVQEMIGTGRASARAATPSEKLPPTASNDSATVIEKIREIYNSSLKINEHVSGNEDDEILNSAVQRGSRSILRPAERVKPVSSRNTERLPSNISSGSSDMDLEPVDPFGNRDTYGRTSKGMGDVDRFDSPMNSRSKIVGREPVTTPSQTHSREFVESRISDKRGIPSQTHSREFVESRISDKRNSRGYQESRESDQPDSRGYPESRVSDHPDSRRYVDSKLSDEHNSRRYLDSRISDEPKSKGYADSRVSDQPNSKAYLDSRVSDQPNSKAYLDSRVSDQPNSRGYTDSRISDQPTSEGYTESRVSDQPNSRAYAESRIIDQPNSKGYTESRIIDQPNSKGYAESRIIDQPNSRGYTDSRIVDQPNSRGYADSRIIDQPNSRGYADSRIIDQPNSRGYAESRIADESNTSRYREPGMTNYSAFEGHLESGMLGQSNYGQSREPELPNWPDSGRYSEFGMHNSGGYREAEMPYQQTSGLYRESEAPNHSVAGVYHQNQNQPLPPPILTPVAPTSYSSVHSAQDQLAELENMAQILAAGMEQQQGQAASDSAPDVWNNPSQQASTSAPQTYSAGPQLYTQGPQTYTSGPQQYSAGPQPYSTGPPFQFSGPQHQQGPNMNFTGPPIQPNIHQPFVRGANPQPAPWPPSNFF
ncbi:unnamed protein product [Candidula unifasciata]|uniref:Uncharacterized protein n=1 Tax=Candidula unifasciata TaxID=100452 RepID=A0A8S4A5Q1_9EUPU|nr:unnamed protein product [Candidula unifasciata]